MKYIKNIIILFIWFFISDISYGQTSWVWQNPLPQGNDLTSVKFFDDNTGWAVGKKGTILKSTDGGINWNIQNSTVYENLNSVFILSEQKVLALGEYGVVVLTTNGGVNWSFSLLAENPSLKKFFFTDEVTGYICGYRADIRKSYIYKTTDGGIYWNLTFTGPESEFFDKIFFWDKNTGITGGDWFAYKTTNAGVNWIQQSYLIRGNELTFKDYNEGMIVGGFSSGYVRKTTNGGVSYYTLFNSNDTVFNSISMVNSFTGYVSGKYGSIRKTTDYGYSWNSLISNVNENLSSIYFSGNNNGNAVGNSGIIINSTNEGMNWSNQRKGMTHTFYSSIFQNENTGWITGTFGIIKTTNGGSNWQNVWDSICYGNLDNLLKFTDDQNGWLFHKPQHWSGDFNLYNTSNSGNNWSLVTSLNSGNVDYYPYALDFTNNTTGFVAGHSVHFIWPTIPIYGFVYRTTDGGQTWERSLFDNNFMYDVEFVNASTGFLAGDMDKVLKTTNTGSNWNYLNMNLTGYKYYKICFINEDLGWILGEQRSNGVDPVFNAILKTTNGGSNWENQLPLNSISGLKSLQFIDKNIGWTCGNGGLIYATSNGGQNWIKQDNPANQNLYSINFVDYNTGWVCGSNGTILKTNSGIIPVGIITSNITAPQNFILSQNYPNPFNPITIIRYSIPSDVRGQTSDVKLVVYNNLGKEIITLVNEKQNPGSYAVDFNGEGLPSGVYFYKLEAGEFEETKRMILLK